jgi:hypothetical protein
MRLPTLNSSFSTFSTARSLCVLSRISPWATSSITFQLRLTRPSACLWSARWRRHRLLNVWEPGRVIIRQTTTSRSRARTLAGRPPDVGVGDPPWLSPPDRLLFSFDASEEVSRRNDGYKAEA